MFEQFSLSACILQCSKKNFGCGWKSHFVLCSATLCFVELNKSAASDTESMPLHYLSPFQSRLFSSSEVFRCFIIEFLWRKTLGPWGRARFSCPYVPARLLYVVVPSSDSLSELSCFRAAMRLSFIFLCEKKAKENLSEGQIWSFLQGQWRQARRTLEILSLLHWLTPLLTLTMHSTARLRACCTSSRGGTMEMLGMERVTLARKMACWLLLLPRLGASPSAEWCCKFKGWHLLLRAENGGTHAHVSCWQPKRSSRKTYLLIALFQGNKAFIKM